MTRPPSLQMIQAEISRLDPKLQTDDECYKIAVILMASGVSVGPNIKRLAKFTKYPRSVIAPYSRRLRRQGIWRGGKVIAEWFGQNGGVAFWLDVSVARGWLNTVRD